MRKEIKKMFDDFDRIQSDECGDGYFNEQQSLNEELHEAALEHTGPRSPRRKDNSKLSAEDYFDLLIENYS